MSHQQQDAAEDVLLQEPKIRVVYENRSRSVYAPLPLRALHAIHITTGKGVAVAAAAEPVGLSMPTDSLLIRFNEADNRQECHFRARGSPHEKRNVGTDDDASKEAAL